MPEPLELLEAPLSWRRAVVEQHVRRARTRPQPPGAIDLQGIELEAFGGAHGAFSIVSVVFKDEAGGLSWVTQVRSARREAASATAATLGAVLGYDAWTIEKKGGGFLISKPIEPMSGVRP